MGQKSWWNLNLQTKEKIKAVMRQYLEDRGWPNLPNPDEFVLDSVEGMFRELLRLNLVKYADFESFYLAAISQYEKAQLRKQGYDV